MSYIIQLEDMITLKVNEDVQRTGALLELLKKNRVVSLTESFSETGATVGGQGSVSSDRLSGNGYQFSGNRLRATGIRISFSLFHSGLDEAVERST